MTHDQFIDFARELRDIGASQVTAGEYSVTFAAPVRAVVAPLPRNVQPPDEDAKPVDRQAFRALVMEQLGNG